MTKVFSHPTGLLLADKSRAKCSQKYQHTAGILGEGLQPHWSRLLQCFLDFHVFYGQAEKEVGVGRQQLKCPISASCLLDHLSQWNA